MEDYEFNMGMKRIRGCFPNQFNDEKSLILFEKLFKFTWEQFSQICDFIIFNFKYAPTVAEFIEIARSKFPASFNQILGSCGSCENGLIMATHTRVKSMPFAFLCNCETGSRRLEKYPVWNSQYSKIFTKGIEDVQITWSEKEKRDLIAGKFNVKKIDQCLT